jgi:hypothetical protein
MDSPLTIQGDLTDKLGAACAKLQVARKVKSMNVEHPTSNIEPPILMTLRFINFKQVNRNLRRVPLDVLGA